MSTDYKPGTVAMVTNDDEELLAFRVSYPADDWISADDGGLYDVTAVRPLVTLDPVEITGPDETGDLPAAPEIVKCLRRLAEGDHPGSYRRKVAERIADAIEAQTKPPKPPEPTGLGAVVEDAGGKVWVRVTKTGCPWQSSEPDGLAPLGCYWDDIDAVRILSEGVQP